MSYLLNLIIIFLLSALTIGFFPYISPVNTVPLLPLIFLIPLAYFRKGFEPILVAALAGLFFDLYSAYQFGFYIIYFLMVVAIIRVLFHEGLNHISFALFTTIILSAISALFVIQSVIVYLGEASLKITDVLFSFGYLVVINFIAASLIYLGINWYFDKLKELEINSRRR
jgi:cell shape-determining protein MreD